MDGCIKGADVGVPVKMWVHASPAQMKCEDETIRSCVRAVMAN